MYELRCPSIKHCDPRSRWRCSLQADWIGAGGSPPWGADDRQSVLRFLAGADRAELTQLADMAAAVLDDGSWEGVVTPNGGWVDGEPCDDEERSWRKAARDFLERYQSGARVLTEGMLRYATWNLACELAWMRGWCPLAALGGIGS